MLRGHWARIIYRFKKKSMFMSNNPFDIARETLRVLAARRTPPTPDNYLTLYHEIAGTQPNAEVFPEKQLRYLANALPKHTPEQLRVSRELESCIQENNWESFREKLTSYVTNLAEAQKLTWSDLIFDLVMQLETRQPNLTQARKREALEHVLKSCTVNSEILFQRLKNLTRAWKEGKEENLPSTSTETPLAESTQPESSDFYLYLKEINRFTLAEALPVLLRDDPKLVLTAQSLAEEVEKLSNEQNIKPFLESLRKLHHEIELLAEDQNELRSSLLSLLRLLIENISELVLDDRWLHGQIEVIRNLIDKPLSQHSIDDAERRLKEVLYKQNELKNGLNDAKDALKHMLAGFVDHLADFADATSEYHDKIEHCAEKINQADNITDLGDLLQEVIHETKSIQDNAKRARDELRSTQQKVEESEARILELEKALEATSQLVRYDQLTGALNRRGLDEMFQKEIARALRHETPLCIGLLDIDNFKRLNDNLGHQTGDQALIHLANVCRETLRPQDSLSRYGGEEFIILLPDTLLEDAKAVLTRLQRELTKKFFMHGNERVLITFSAGVTLLAPEDTQESALNRADQAMYTAKRSGKNQVVSV